VNKSAAVYPTRQWWLHLGLALAVMALLIAQQWLAIPGSGRVLRGLQNAMHGPWFALVTWLVAILVERWLGGAARVAIIAALVAVLAVGTELMQRFTGGDAEWSDVGFDLVGAAAALIVRYGGRVGMSQRLAMTAGAVLLAIALAPLANAVAIEGYRRSIAPELVRFDGVFAAALYRANSPVEVVATRDGWTAVADVLRIHLADETWPGVTFDEPIADWRGYAALTVDAYVHGAESMPVTVSVRLDDAPVEHVYRTFDCGRGVCRIVLPIAEMFDPARARVNAVVIYSTRAFAGRTLDLGRIALQ